MMHPNYKKRRRKKKKDGMMKHARYALLKKRRKEDYFNYTKKVHLKERKTVHERKKGKEESPPFFVSLPFFFLS